jgi:16S rRNA (uracil1498-N3)-methyltransferase
VARFEAGAAVLRGEAAHHLGRVLRAEPGQLFELSDAESVWLARAERVGRDSIEFRLVEQLPAPVSRLRITILLSIVKFDRFEWALEKATELGADEIVPLTAERSEKGLVSAAAKRGARWEKILFEAAQQARRLRVPALGKAAPPSRAFGDAPDGIRLLLSERSGARPMREVLGPSARLVGEGKIVPVALAIGPEGGWTDAEISSATAAGFSEISLGAAILRTETAVCAALAAVQYALGESRTPVEEAAPSGAKEAERI